ncbi:alpha/beta hydrolase [Macrococcus equipercicus]|uniref:Alpha/beta hydrolase n=1 Tax=Macrococcus equipercicus TaxID=69967 RepID=A0ABQ6RAW5_9STAP|nr:alpha/beta hydrolase [Macrococcus equipercicus]KAA1042355.1 alpha/beta hydrolase [Macrococcus equipercicus]
MKKLLWMGGSILWLFVIGLIADQIPRDSAQITGPVFKNDNITMYRNITYSKIHDSQLDILMPKKVKKGDKLPLILWTHGGGFIAGDKKHKNPYLAQLAEKGFIIANMNYALAPEYQYPTPIKQQIAAAGYMMRNTLRLPLDKTQIVIGGDSAGAQLASQFAAIQTNPLLRKEMAVSQSFSQSQLKAVILFGGFYDMNSVRATKFPRINLFMESYTGEADWEKNFLPLDQMSTVKQVTAKYPPTFLTVGDADPFDSQGKELVAVLKKNQVPYKTAFFDRTHRLPHQYQFHMQLKESQLTYQQLLMFLGRYTNQVPYDAGTKGTGAGI